ncbi:MAG: triose-phosphate isomerase [Pedobacter sp.]|nr:MAG: triose-phosphate isomerase [Pedobacter sp.]
MRKKIVAGNWKMNLDYETGLGVFSEIVNMLRDEKQGGQQVVICAPFIHLHSLAKLSAEVLAVGAQNCHAADSGAFTGEISAGMLKSIACEYVILGHSERRQYFQESDSLIFEKTKAALKHNLKPIFCIGETLEERNSGNFFQLLEKQLKDGLFGLDVNEFKQVVIAYEPVWAIGTGLTASPQQAQEVHAFIRQTIATQYGTEVAENSTILYGGSCNAQNAPELFAQSDIDGGLIGGASLKSRDFVNIVKALNH